MATTPRAKSRKHKIEPLDWTQAAQSPAFKGMVSFLDISPEEIRKRNQALEGKEEAPPDLAPDAASAASGDAGIDTHTGRDARTGGDAPIGSKVQEAVVKSAKVETKAKTKPAAKAVSDTHIAVVAVDVEPTPKSNPLGGADPMSVSSAVGDTHTGSESLPAIESSASVPTKSSLDDDAPLEMTDSEALPDIDAHTGSDVGTGFDSLTGPVLTSTGSPVEAVTPQADSSHAIHLQGESLIDLPVSDTRTGSESLPPDIVSVSAPTSTIPGETNQAANRSRSETLIGSLGVQTTELVEASDVEESKAEPAKVSDTRTGIETHTGFDPQPGSDPLTGYSPEPNSATHVLNRVEPSVLPKSDPLPGMSVSHQPVSESRTASKPGQLDTSSAKSLRESRTGSDPRIGSEAFQEAPVASDLDPYESSVSPVSESSVAAKRSQVANVTPAPSAYTPPTPYQPIYPKSIARVAPVGASRPISESLSRAEEDYYSRSNTPLRMVPGNVPSLNRKIRKCKLAQDGHSQGEEILYDKMWEAAQADPANPGGSRTLRIGYAELAAKARMHRTNVRINLAGLRAKLALEILDEHVSRDVLPRLYRIYSYKEILERRKAAGLEYVIRKKSVIFVTPTGEPIPLEGLLQPSRRRAQSQGEAAIAPANPVTQPLTPEAQEEMEAEIRQISEALNRYWTTDESAARQLLYACRRVRFDARIEEILFFVEEKLELSRRNPGVINPTGLILATVPQSFEGYAFNQFRRRHEEQLRIAREEEMRRQEQAKAMEHWLLTEISRYQAILDDPHTGEEEKARAREMMKPLTSRFS